MATVAPASFADHYKTSGYAAFEQEHRAARAAPFTIMSVRQDSHDFTDPPVPELVVAAARRTGMTFRWDIGDGWTRPVKVRSGSLHVLPPETFARIECDGENDMLFLSVPVDYLEGVLSESGASLADVTSGNTDYFHDPALVRMMEALWMEMQGRTPASRLKTDGLFLSLMGGLLARAAAEGPKPGPRLSRRQMSTVTDLIESRLDDALSIRDLASELGYSQFQFTRAFKAAFGQTPHNYLLHRRIERARSLLGDTDRALADIAYACGFASQSHMTDVFRNILGTTPGRYRRNAVM